MRPRRPISEEGTEGLFLLLKQAKSKAQFQRVQCLWLRAALDLSAAQIGIAIGWKPGSVKQLHSRYLNEGQSALKGPGRGGRRNSYLTPEEEERFLSQFIGRAAQSRMLVVSEIKAAFEKKIGRTVPKSTVYRMLARHGWRKITPRPHHPKSDEATQEAFKKNSLKPSSPYSSNNPRRDDSA